MPVYGLDVSADAIKRAYVLNFINYISWEGEQSFLEYRIAIVGQDEQFFKAFKKDVATRRAKDKRVAIEKITDLKKLPKFHIVYVTQDSSSLLNNISNITSGTNTLVISDNSDDKRDFMINLVLTPKGNVTFEINKSKLVYENLKLHNDVLLLGGTELDVAEFVHEIESTLRETKNEVQRQQQKLRNQEKLFKQQQKQLGEQEKRLKGQQQQLGEQEKRLKGQQQQSRAQGKLLMERQQQLDEQLDLVHIQGKNAQEQERRLHEKEEKLKSVSVEFEQAISSLKATQATLSNSKKELTEQQSSLAFKEQKMSSLTKLIDKNNSVLEKQQTELSDQELLLTEHVDTIGQQRLLLAAASFAIALFVILIMVILRIIQTRLRLNRDLSTSNEALKNAQAQLQDAKSTAEAANHAKSMFLANMSHEIRTPMNAILGFAQLLRGDRSLSEKHQRNIRTINNSGEHLLGLINDILDMSKIEAGRMELVEDDFDLNALMNDIKVMFAVRANEKNISLDFEIESEVPQYVRADQGKLSQIVINLLSNAMKFTNQGSIVVRQRVLSREAERLKIEISVTDSGEGIPEGDLESIFNAFEQSDTGQRAGGTGLGLAISRQMGRMMGGGIKVENVPGGGTRFVLTVTLIAVGHAVAAQQTVHRQVIGLAEGQPRPLTLVVDDSDDNRDLLLQLLKPAGFHLIEAVDGLEAVTQFEQHHPAIILTDIVMPKLNGLEAMRQIRSMPGGEQVRIIAVSANVLGGEMDEALKAGADAMLRKPIRIEQLFNALEQHAGLEFMYEDIATPSTDSLQQVASAQIGPEQIDKLPDDLRETILNAVAIGDITEMSQQVEKVKGLDGVLGEHLANLVTEFEFEAIQRLLNRTIGNRANEPVTSLPSD